jgi:uncharacterized protein (TIGR02996 family)
VHEALLAAIAADLDDDAPRLVLADALQRDGDPRGELIAVQCELARLGLRRLRQGDDWIGDLIADGDPDAIAKLRKREAKLLADHGAAWASELAGLAWGTAHRFARGFVEHVAVWPEADLLDRLFARAPMLRSLHLQLKSDGSAARPLAETTRLRQIAAVSIGWSDADTIRAVIESPQLANVRALAFADDKLGDATIAAVRDAAWFPRLETLAVHMYAGDAAAEVIATTNALVELRLTVTEDAAAVASLANLGRLEVLELEAKATSHVAPALADLVEQTRELRALRLAGVEIRAAGAAAIGALRELRVLDLSGVPLGTRGWTDLARAGGLGRLRDLRLDRTTLDGDTSIRALIDSPLLARLVRLSLRENYLGDAGLFALAASEACANLRVLDLTTNAKITARGLDALARSPYLQRCKVSKSRIRR